MQRKPSETDTANSYIIQVYTLLSQTADYSGSNQRKLRDPTVLGGWVSKERISLLTHNNLRVQQGAHWTSVISDKGWVKMFHCHLLLKSKE
jgi:hypothetical protein